MTRIPPHRSLVVLAWSLPIAVVFVAGPQARHLVPGEGTPVGTIHATATAAGQPVAPSTPALAPVSPPSPSPERTAPAAPTPAPTANSPTAQPTPTPAPAGPRSPRTATIAFTGDIIPHVPVMDAAAATVDDGWDFRGMFDDVRPVLARADVALCHLETPISADDTDLGTYPMFNAPRALVTAIAEAGYDGCSTASNHSFDRRGEGVRATIDALDANGLRQAGTARTAAQDLEPVLYDANGITIAHIAATFWLNGFELPEDEPWLVDLIEPAEILREADAARAAGAEFVVVSLHWGNEYQHEPSAEQVAMLEQILPSGKVDMVVGHHAHVVQPIDRLHGEWVVFGLGNFLSNQSGDCCAVATQDGMIATVKLRERLDGTIAATGVQYVPTWVDRADGYVIRIATDEASREDIAGELAESAARTRAVVGSRLTARDGLSTRHGSPGR